ncbi:SRPBCC family protein [Cellulosimicrobium sp. NPDC057127]|uniref:SRPBCC family protein n=1 Tax=Cellulosimicrobium sp. NPDC057127 TaxID=3346026 RepID=UPI0036412A2D
MRRTGRRGVDVLAVVAVAVGTLLLTRRMTQTWGTRDDEHDAPLPGDELVTGPGVVVATRAVSIAAAPRDVWPWLVQLGQGRGGFYSYDALENLAGLRIRSADAIEDRWQALAVGDDIHLAEQVALRVALLEPEDHLLLLGAPEPGETDVMPFAFSWAFVVRPLPPGDEDTVRTRLLVRERYRPAHPWGRAVVEAVQPVSFLMTQRMLRGVRDRAEGLADGLSRGTPR